MAPTITRKAWTWIASAVLAWAVFLLLAAAGAAAVLAAAGVAGVAGCAATSIAPAESSVRAQVERPTRSTRTTVRVTPPAAEPADLRRPGGGGAASPGREVRP